MLQKMVDVVKKVVAHRTAKLGEKEEKGTVIVNSTEFAYTLSWDDLPTMALTLENMDNGKRSKWTMRSDGTDPQKDFIDQLNSRRLVRLLMMTIPHYKFENIRKKRTRPDRSNPKRAKYEQLIDSMKTRMLAVTLPNLKTQTHIQGFTENDIEQLLNWTSVNRGYGTGHWGSFGVDVLCTNLHLLPVQDIPHLHSQLLYILSKVERKAPDGSANTKPAVGYRAIIKLSEEYPIINAFMVECTNERNSVACSRVTYMFEILAKYLSLQLNKKDTTRSKSSLVGNKKIDLCSKVDTVAGGSDTHPRQGLVDLGSVLDNWPV